MELPEDFKKKLSSVKNKRAKAVIDIILEKGHCSTEDLKNIGYEHPPRAARDVREQGIPLETFSVKDKSGKTISAYRFGNWEQYCENDNLKKTSGRTQLSKKLKQALIEKHGPVCWIYQEPYPERQLQVDHRIPYEILGEQDEADINSFMLLSPSGNRDKSWTCEHCPNWIKKDVSICKTCFYAYPESYTHIAEEEEKRIHLSFKGTDIELYDQVKEFSNAEKISLQKAFKIFCKRGLMYKDLTSSHKK
jgi:hypothetical protein